mmetsp:Transcript_45411/g.99234  ORF Transcript_45411/g.99234 Transcript_45411/m.99234 type:complete len:234 (-) Transcript_45411:49-750(-)
MKAPRRQSTRRPRLLALSAAGALSLGALSSLGFAPVPGAPEPALAGRRGFAAGALAALLGGATAAPQAALAEGPKPVTEKDLKRIKAGYDDLVDLMANWNKRTRDCTGSKGNQDIAMQAGVQSPDKCTANPDVVRKYMGDRNLDDKLFKSQQLWINIDAGDIISSKDEDRWQDAVEEFELHRRQSSEWAYTSSWGENNPGGGRDKVEDYLLKSKAEAVLATKALGVIVDCLKL